MVTASKDRHFNTVCLGSVEVQRNATSDRNAVPLQVNSLFQSLDAKRRPREADQARESASGGPIERSPSGRSEEDAGSPNGALMSIIVCNSFRAYENRGQTALPKDSQAYSDCSKFNAEILAEIKEPEADHGHKSEALAELEVANELAESATVKRFGFELSEELDKRAYRAKAKKLRECGSWLVFRKWIEAGHLQLRAANSCHQFKLCASCARRRAAKYCQTYWAKALQICSDHDLVPVLVTLHQRNGDDLRECFDRFRRSLRSLSQSMRRGRTVKGRHSAWGDAFPAILWQVEIKRGSGSSQWHVHAHGLALRPRTHRLNFKALTEEWQRLTGNTGTPNFKLTTVGRLLVKGVPLHKLADHFRSDVMEVIKYPTKLDELAPSDLIEIDQKTKAARFLFPWGHFRGAEPDASLTDQTEYWGEWVEYQARWNARHRAYDRRLKCTSGGEVTKANVRSAAVADPAVTVPESSLPF